MLNAYLRIVCAQIDRDSNFFLARKFSVNGENFLSANFFTEKKSNWLLASKKS
jgi:hypothetical protein